MDDIDTNELRKLAEAATPGPWGIVGIDDLPEINDLMIVSDAVLGDGEPAWITNIGGPFSQVAGEGMDPSQDERNARFIAAANPTTILSLLDRLDETERRLAAVCNAATIKGAGRSVVRDRTLEEQLAAMTARAEKAERERDELSSRLECEQYENVALRERAEKAERERDESAKGLSILRECTVAERDRIYGYEMAKLRAELARMTADRDSHCEHANQESSRASDYAEANETLRTRVAALESEVKRLREVMPSEDALKGAIAALVIVESVSRKTGNPMVEPARDWLARLDAARGGAK